MQKVAWSGTIAAVQPRIRLIRCDDERQHSYHGYVLRIEGTCGGESGEVMVAVGRAAHAKHRFRVGMEVSGLAVPVADPQHRDGGVVQAEPPQGRQRRGGGTVERPAVPWRAAGYGYVPRARTSPAGHPDLRYPVRHLHLGLSHAGGIGAGSLDPVQETLSGRDLLLWSQEL